ncbi:hypothetical protein C121_96 [Stenotrophomonas phage C121]|uniref:hypothetical protein n=1 Tax=Stenotrophomonas phage C121 TaxID=2914029 RepID=UPI0023294C40|nr:hypothetical protein PP752_gp96 [Stenotrophomonas phage C121]UKL14829.1 hypothetical protein C121_96 [Stenotrophomonas phage C121]
MSDWNREHEAKLRNQEAQAYLSEAHIDRVNAETLWFDAKVKALQTVRILAYVIVAVGSVRIFV